MPIAERAALAAIRADSEGSLGASRARLCRLFIHAAFRRLDGGVRAGAAASIRNLCTRRKAYFGLRTLGLSRCAGKKADHCRAPRYPFKSARPVFWRSIMASPPTPSLSDGITRRRCIFHARVSDNAVISAQRAHRVLAAARLAWPDEAEVASGSIPPGATPRATRMSRSPGSQRKCQSSRNVEMRHYLEAFRRAGLD